MPCFHPITAYKGPDGNGGTRVVFDKSKSYRDLPSFKIKCDQCIGCRLERSRQWAIRCMHEASLHADNSFITLTYSDENLPYRGTLVKRDFQLFMKRLRRRSGAKFKFYYCGEYGENFGRPHYHACLFGYDFPDKEIFTVRNDYPVWRSSLLEELWPYGFSEIGTVTFESAGYVARYILKKQTGKSAEDHYSRVDPETGEIYQLLPEYTNMSNRGGIGKDWITKFKDDVYPSDEVIVNGIPVKPPKFYDRQFEILYPDEYVKLKRARVKSSRLYVDNNTPDRLKVREKVTLSKLEFLPRKLE